MRIDGLQYLNPIATFHRIGENLPLVRRIHCQLGCGNSAGENGSVSGYAKGSPAGDAQVGTGTQAQ
jgi:hypothetical protein